MIKTNKDVSVFFTYLLLMCLLYRFSFLGEILIANNSISSSMLLGMSLGFIDDFFVCLIAATTLYFLQAVIRKPKRVIHLASILFIVIFIALLSVNTKALLLLMISINATMISAYIHHGWSVLGLFTFYNIFDAIFIAAAIGGYFLLKSLSIKQLHKILLLGLLPVYYVFAIYGSVTLLNTLQHNKESALKTTISLYRNPLHEVITTYCIGRSGYNQIHFQPDNAQLTSIKLLNTPFTFPNNSKSVFKNSSALAKPYNIVVFVMESVGEDYVFPSNHTASPMPFLQSLARKGILFNNHYSSGNISALGQFSIFTGLYPYPKPIHFEFQNHKHITTIVDWLPPTFASLFVSASNDLYFSMVINHSFHEYDNASIIDPQNKTLFLNMFIDENLAFDYFANKLKNTRSPFVATYWSGATHYPYKDYSHFSKLSFGNKTNFARYTHALNLLDQEIEKTYEILKEKKLLDNTIFVIVGDHGESFGQHDQNYIHGKSMYQEEIKVPFVMFSPKLFKPAVIHQATSSVDILPILLQAEHINYRTQLQGYTLQQALAERNYIFSYGDQDEIAAIDRNNIKMIISFAANQCRTFDLVRDPLEQHALVCDNAKQREAILKYRNYQPIILDRLVVGNMSSRGQVAG